MYAKLCFGRVLKRSLSAHLMQVKLLLFIFLFEWRIACSFYRETVWTDVKFLDDSVFIKTESEPSFGFPHISSVYRADKNGEHYSR